MDTTTNGAGRGAPVRLLAWGGAVALLLLPLAAMQFTSEMNWTAYDFAVWAGLIAGAGLLIELAVRVLRTPLYRFIAVGAILALALLVWADGAVGLLS